MKHYFQPENHENGLQSLQVMIMLLLTFPVGEKLGAGSGAKEDPLLSPDGTGSPQISNR